MINGTRRRNQQQELLSSAEYIHAHAAETAHLQKYKRMSVFLENSNLGFYVNFVLQCLSAALKKPEKNTDSPSYPAEFM